MKRFVLMSLFACFAVFASAQVQFVPYRPIYGSGGSSSYTQPQRQQQQERLQTVNAYFVNQRGSFEKLRIKVGMVQGTYGSVTVVVRGYQDKTFNRWYDMNSNASEVDALDPAVIKENFDYKCFISGYGYIYF